MLTHTSLLVADVVLAHVATLYFLHAAMQGGATIPRAHGLPRALRIAGTDDAGTPAISQDNASASSPPC